MTKNRKPSRMEKKITLIKSVKSDFSKLKKPGISNRYIVLKLAGKHARTERRIYQILKIK